MMQQEYFVDLLFQEAAMPAGRPESDPERQAGAEGQPSVFDTPFAFALMLIRHARRSRGITAPKRRIA